MKDSGVIAIVGGGAAGFFAAISAAESRTRDKVLLFEGGNRLLRKVKISGGGRCNLTHHCFDPMELSKNYPRGSRELRGAFHAWQPQDTISWFEENGVDTKTEEDGRIFPASDQSQTIIDCLLNSAKQAGVSLKMEKRLLDLRREDTHWELEFSGSEVVRANCVCLALGSLKESGILNALKSLGHSIEPLIPSLFAFNLADHPLKELAGVSVADAKIRTLPLGKPHSGPILITHRGLSGPAVLRASAWDAKSLAEQKYEFEAKINWLGDKSKERLIGEFVDFRKDRGKVSLAQSPYPQIPKRLWRKLVEISGLGMTTTWSHLSREKSLRLAENLANYAIQVNGKTTNKEEFVTCGGIDLKEVNFRTMQSKIQPGLFFAGECLDFDGITGGFNFQAAWTTGRIAGISMAEICSS